MKSVEKPDEMDAHPLKIHRFGLPAGRGHSLARRQGGRHEGLARKLHSFNKAKAIMSTKVMPMTKTQNLKEHHALLHHTYN